MEEEILFYSGRNFIVANTSSDEIFVVGNNEYGQLGLGDNLERQTPHFLPSPSNYPWKRFFCGFTHSIGLTTSGEAYIWGENGEGQLGLEKKEEQHRPSNFKRLMKEVRNFGRRRRRIPQNKGDITSPQLLAPQDAEWESFACGFGFTVALTRSNTAYVWGLNDLGQLGLGDEKIRTSPELFPSPSKSPWQKFFCGAFHTIGMTASGEVFVWGLNDCGQLGVGRACKKQRIPRRLPAPSKSSWLTFFCGDAATIGIIVSGEAYFWETRRN